VVSHKPLVVIAVAGTVLVAVVLGGCALGRASVRTTAVLAHAAKATPPANTAVIGSPPAPQLPPGGGPYRSVVGTGSGTVALTFDDGPDPQWTPQMLDVLKGAGVRATFCLIGRSAAAFPDLVRAIVAAGHTLCNHSWNHNLSLRKLSRAAIRADLTRTNAAIAAAVPGAHVAYFRAPGGNWSGSIVAVARDLGMASLGWAVDTRDWTVPPVAGLVSLVNRSCRNGAIILMHDGGGNRRNSVEAVRQFLPGLVSAHAFVPLPTGSS
jgi:peptidoglycan/xylan/chitin deacetylase (PgdA/CDA1 family)